MAKKTTTSKKTTKKTKADAAKAAADASVESVDVDALNDQINELQDQVLSLTKEKDQLEKDAADAKDQSLRSLAELENVKRRKEQEKVDAIKFGNERLINDLLPILDAFDLAMGQSAVSESEEVKAVITGFEMIQKQISQFLEKIGVEKIESLDQPFDPNLHQGISQESHPDKDENTVVKEMQPGYKLNDRVIRPAMVVVSTK
ncbi:MAG: nucleotide exchange factor GrpE [Candidatus Marinamargulisbacteria bacterium]